MLEMIQTVVQFMSEGIKVKIITLICIQFLIYCLFLRAFHDGDQLPAKVIPSKQSCFVSHNGLEVFKSHFDYLSGSGFNWVASSNGHTPEGAVIAGVTVHGDELAIGRAHHEGSVTPGKINRNHGCLYFPFGGAEQSTLYYEALVCEQKCELI